MISGLFRNYGMLESLRTVRKAFSDTKRNLLRPSAACEVLRKEARPKPRSIPIGFRV